jgi:hypothetical protein
MPGKGPSFGKVPNGKFTPSSSDAAKFSSVNPDARATAPRATRAKAIAKLTAGLEQIARSVREGRRHTDPAAVARRVAKLFGKRGAASYFTWELQPLSAAEQAALPAPGRGCRRPSQRFVYHFDAARAEADAH